VTSGSLDKTVKLWDVSVERVRAVLKGHADKIVSVSFSGDGRRLVSCDATDMTLVWDTATGEQVKESPPTTILDGPMSPDGTLEARVQGNRILLLDRHWKEPPLPPLFQPDPTWHAEQAALAESEKQPFAVAFHLGKLADFQPWDSRLRQREAEAWMKAGQKERAALAYVRAHFGAYPSTKLP
jgi:hypothetical protein